MGAILKILSGLVGIFDKMFGNQRDNELREDGARKADLAQRDKADEIRKDAKEFRNQPKPADRRGAASRLRGHKGKS